MSKSVKKKRLEGFSDGVLAIIITIMVLDLKVPTDKDGFYSLHGLVPIFTSYILSYLYVGIYWNNHHQLVHALSRVSGGILWANLNLLFWLSLIPFVTGWMGENHFDALPTALYGFVLLMSAVAYWILGWKMVQLEGKDSISAPALGSDFKGDGR